MCVRKSILFLLFASVCVGLSAQAQDTLRVLCIGNSFTEVENVCDKLQRITRAEGHFLVLNPQLRGGYSFQRHMRRDETMSAVIFYTFDVVFLQEQSQMPALYAQSPRQCRIIKKDAQEIAERIRLFSPNARLVYEQTWAFEQGNFGGFGSYDHFDRLLAKGTRKLAHAIQADVSPIGEAFRLCREQYPEIDLYAPDRKHQSAYGAYLKACVNYQMLYHTPFTEEENCGLDSDACAKLRIIAEKIRGVE